MGTKMKKIIAASLLLVSQALFAGGYYNSGQIDTYDAATGLYFKSIERLVEGGGILGGKSGGVETVNINVFNPDTGESRLLFQAPPNGPIIAVLFESGFKDGSVIFGGSGSGNPHYVDNNQFLEKRSPKNSVLVATRNPERKETTLYVTEKQSGHLRRVATFPGNVSWHIDVRNSKIRLVQQTASGLKIDSFPW